LRALVLLLTALLPLAALAAPTPVPRPLPRPFDLVLADVRPPAAEAVALGREIRVRMTVRNLGPGASPPAVARCLFLAAGLSAQVRETPVRALAPNAEAVVEVAARLHFAAAWLLECSVDPGLTPDRTFDNNCRGGFVIFVPPQPTYP